MPKIKFSAFKIKSLKPTTKSVEYFDSERKPGDRALGIRVSPKGKKTWFLLYYVPGVDGEKGKSRRYNLGEYPNITLKKANDLAANNRKGDPLAEEREAKAAMIKGKREAAEEEKRKKRMHHLWDAYQEELNKRIKKKAASTLKEETRKWEKVIEPALGDMLIEDITPADIANLLDTVAETAPVNANRLHSLLRVMFKPALQKGWITIHPMQWLDKPGGAEPPRERVLSDDEIKKLWPFFNVARPNPRDIFRLLLLTAQRPGEIMAMRWEDIDFETRTWTQKNNKTKKVHNVPLSPQVIAILEKRKNDSQWVFPSNHNKAKGAISGHSKSTKDARRNLKEKSGIDDWTAHDLRRTARTIMSRLKIKQHIRERVLNHKQKGVVGVYDQYDYLQEKADALDKLGREIYRIIGIEVKGELLDFRRAS